MKKTVLIITVILLIIVLGIIYIRYESQGTLQASKTEIVFQEKIDLRADLSSIVPKEKLDKIDELFSLDASEFYRIRYLSDGLEVVGFIVKPKDDGQYPVIIYNRGGVGDDGKITEMNLAYFSSFVSKGYVVIATQYRGNDGGEGRDELGGKDINDVLNLIPLSKSLPYIDPNNIFMIGESRGGMMTYQAIKLGADINAAVTLGAPTDVIDGLGFYKQGIYEHYIGGNPSEYKEEYIKRSAYYWAEEIDVPILILHGGKDARVSVNDSIKLAERLAEIGNVEYELKIIQDADHGFRGYSEEKDKKILEWFEKHFH